MKAVIVHGPQGCGNTRTAVATRSAWNITTYAGQLSWTVSRYLSADKKHTEWMRNAAGEVIRFRSRTAAQAAIDADVRAEARA